MNELEWADVRAPSSREESGTPFSARQRPPQFPLRPYSRIQKRSGDLEAARLEENLRGGDHVPLPRRLSST
jgi:hypothetical protein